MAELDDILNMLGAGGDGENAPDPELLLKILDIASRLGEDDKNTELLKALRPLLREENRPKLDRAARLLRLMSIIPLLRELGLGNGLF